MKKRYIVLIGVGILILFVSVFTVPRFLENNKPYVYNVYSNDSTYSNGVLCVTRSCSGCHKKISIFDRDFHPEKLSYHRTSATVRGTYVCKNSTCIRYNEEQSWYVYVYREEILPVGKKYEYDFVCVENALYYDYNEEKQLLVVTSRCKFCDRIVTNALREFEITDKPFSENKRVLRKSFRCYCNYEKSQVWQIDILRTVV